MNEKRMTLTRMEAPAQLPVRKRVAAYARVSMEKDAMLHSLAAQVSYYSERIQRNPEWEYAGVFADFGLTGTKETRPEFQRMLKECREGKIDLILVKSISRFARNTLALLNTVRELKGLGIGVYFEEQKLDSSIYITLETLKYLKKGGRITPAAAAIGTVLNLKPVLQIQGEKLDAYSKTRIRRNVCRLCRSISRARRAA